MMGAGCSQEEIVNDKLRIDPIGIHWLSIAENVNR